MHRGLGELAPCIDVLRGYLDHHSNDREAWEELADCYLEVRGLWILENGRACAPVTT